MSILSRLWSATAAIAAPGLRLMLRVRVLQGKEIPGRLEERRGVERTTRGEGSLLWLHAASVGETVSILPVLQRLCDRAPTLHVLVTTGTVTSAQLLGQRLKDLRLADRVVHRFVPLDVPRWVSRFLDHWRPDAAGFVESELWPNILAHLRDRRIPTVLLNARMSPRSYANWVRAPGFAGEILGCFSTVQARTEEDAGRLKALGARRVTVPGDLKFSADALPVNEADLAELARLIGGRPVWLAASTHPDEEKMVINVHRALAAHFPGLLTIIVPRHHRRGERIAAEAGTLPMTRRAAGELPPEGGIWIADTMGELGLFYRLAPIVFVGRSLLPPGGGQNPLEPARLGCAVAVGPHTHNFTEAVRALADAGALSQVADAQALEQWVATMLRDSGRRVQAANAGVAVSERYADLPDRTAAMLLALVSDRRHFGEE